jgi:hypothetical protein
VRAAHIAGAGAGEHRGDRTGVLALHLRDDAVLDVERYHVDTPSLDPIARTHGRGWCARSTTALFQIGRPDQAVR